MQLLFLQNTSTSAMLSTILMIVVVTSWIQPQPQQQKQQEVMISAFEIKKEISHFASRQRKQQDHKAIMSLQPFRHDKGSRSQRRLMMVTNPTDDDSNNQSYDLSKPIYDLYALRMVRGDAMIQYNLRNQSEPLRINLALIATLFLLCLPSLIVELSGTATTATVIPTTMPLITTDLTVTIPQTIVSWIGAVVCCSFGIQQAQKRNQQLLRIEKECMAGDLQIQLPMTWIASDRPYQKQALSLRDVIKSKSCRIIAISGPTKTLQSIVQNELVIYNKRWIQSNTYCVLIPTDNNEQQSSSTVTFLENIRYPWLAQAYNIERWTNYFQSLTTTSTIESTEKVSWFGLSATGRSFGSGTTKPSSYLQILGNSLSPIDILVPSDNDIDSSMQKDLMKMTPMDDGPIDSLESTKKMLLTRQDNFYDALTNGKLHDMQNRVFGTEYDTDVTEIIQQGGRIDSWDICLLQDAKPTGMTISDREVILLPETNNTIAYTTNIEFPIDTYMGNTIPTLLAVQKWKRTPTSKSSSMISSLSSSSSSNDTDSNSSIDSYNNEWILIQHQTIPWTSDRAAGGTLLCDCRGCVALVRS